MEFMEVLKNRRAVNHFDPNRDVEDSLIREMIERASLAPSSFNLQPWNMIILRDQKDRERLRKVAWDQKKITDAPVVFILLADRSGWREDHPTVKKDFNALLDVGQVTEDQKDWFLNGCKHLYGESAEKQQAFACKNTGFFAMSLMYAAKDLGVDTHPMDGFEHDQVKEEFNIPEQYWIPLLMAVGYFDTSKKLLPPKWRKGFDEIVVSL